MNARNEDLVVEVRGLRKAFGRTRVLADVSFSLPGHGVTVLLGENGAGKSTLLRLLMGLLPSDGGSLRVLGREPFRDGEALRAEVGFVGERFDGPPWMTPRALYRFLAPHYPRWDGARALELAGRYQVPLDTRFAALSRGQDARAQLAAALAIGPRLLLLDECFSGLDPLARRELLAHFLGELAEHDVGVLLTTHDLDTAARAAERVLVLADGRITRSGTLEEVLGEEETPARVPQGLLGLLEESRQVKEVPA
jgi:ABC-2 type transport system ATP-binding protein